MVLYLLEKTSAKAFYLAEMVEDTAKIALFSKLRIIIYKSSLIISKGDVFNGRKKLGIQSR